jgi:ubiquinone/menaquinone biosynthesis C-methylase UbiE
MERLYQAEILDGRDYSREELFQNLRELCLVNRWLGGHAHSAALMKQCIRSGFVPEAVVDIGCGGGDTLEMLEKEFSADLPNCSWIGCDLHPWCLEYAYLHHSGKCIQFLEKDFQQMEIRGSVLYHAALFFHHFPEEDIIRFISFVHSKGSALVINDLHRHPLAYWGIRLLASLPGVGRLFRNDAPLSVQRGFARKEWLQILEKCGIRNYKIRWAWAFRYLIFIPPAEHERN